MIRISESLSHSRKRFSFVLRPNQSLKLTEPAVDDFARAKQSVTIGRDIPRAE